MGNFLKIDQVVAHGYDLRITTKGQDKMDQTSNPALKNFTSQQEVSASSSSSTMTIGGTVNKTLICTALLIISAAFVWKRVLGDQGLQTDSLTPFMLVGGIGGFIVAMFTIFKPAWAFITAPIYCILEGLLLGAISSLMEFQYPGIALQAAGLTIGALVAMLFTFEMGWIKPTEKFRSGLMIAMGGIVLVYLTTMVLGFFGIRVPYIHEGGIIGIGFSLFVIIIASLSLILDFEFIRQNSGGNTPKYMEWYGAFSLMVTLIWLYIEILNLLGKINRK